MKTICQKLLTGLLSLASLGYTAEPPKPCGAVPTAQQVNWLRMEWYAFVHFSLNTFTGKEWGYGDESPSLFNPDNFNADDIVSTFKKAGMTGMIYTAKHHDGWCSWPTKSTGHSVKKSPWKGGKGDVVREFTNACKKHGIKFGVYLSPWDRNCAEYGRPGYLKVYYKQIEELLTHYGPIFEIWFDGANGGDGFYGGAREKRNIGSADTYYNFEKVVKNIRALQPDCIIWGAASRGDVTWGGSETGQVPYPCWNLQKMGTPEEKWISREGDTPINHAGWFWHPGQANRVKSEADLMNTYLVSVGRGANLILNVAPDRSGRLDPADVASLLAFGEARRRLLAVDYAKGAKASASEVRGNDARFDASKVTDGDIESYWCPNDGTNTGSITITLPKPATFDVVRIREQIRLGQRVKGFRVEAWVDGQWKNIIADGATIGNQVMWRLQEAVTSKKLKLTITDSRACPCISEFSLLKMPKEMPRPELRIKNGKLEVEKREGYSIYYTLDGTSPMEKGKHYKGPVDLPENITTPVRVVYKDRADGEFGSEASTRVPVSTKTWTCLKGNAQAAWDSDESTLWTSQKAPASFTVDMGKAVRLDAFSYTPRQDGQVQDMTDRYKLDVSVDGTQWKTVSKGEFSNLRANPIEQEMEIKAQKVRYLRFTAERSVEGNGVSVAEFKVFAAPAPAKDKQAKK